jgi:hypothetical protein
VSRERRSGAAERWISIWFHYAPEGDNYRQT